MARISKYAFRPQTLGKIKIFDRMIAEGRNRHAELGKKNRETIVKKVSSDLNLKFKITPMIDISSTVTVR